MNVPGAGAAVEGRDISLAVAVEVGAVVPHATGGDEGLPGLSRQRQHGEECGCQEPQVEPARGRPHGGVLAHADFSRLVSVRCCLVEGDPSVTA